MWTTDCSCHRTAGARRPATGADRAPRHRGGDNALDAAFAAWRARRAKDASLAQLTSPGTPASALGNLPSDEAAPPTEARGNVGNKQYVMTFPAGEYDAEDGDDVMNIYRVGTSGRELVAQVPPGTYSIVGDEGGAHLYRHADDEPDRIPLSDTPARVGDDMYGALRRYNQRMGRHYQDRQVRSNRPLLGADPALTAYGARMRQFWSRGAA